MARSLAKTKRRNDAAIRLYAPLHASQPYGDEWWERDCLTIAAKTGREFQHLMHACIRAAPNWVQVKRLRDDNEVRIKHLDAATKEDVIAELAAREKELKGEI